MPDAAGKARAALNLYDSGVPNLEMLDSSGGVHAPSILLEAPGEGRFRLAFHDFRRKSVVGSLEFDMVNGTPKLELIDDSGGKVAGPGFSTINAIGIAGQAFNAPGAATGWWLVYNGSLAASEGDVEVVDVSLAKTGSTPEPATDVLLGAAMVGLLALRKRLIHR